MKVFNQQRKVLWGVTITISLLFATASLLLYHFNQTSATQQKWHHIEKLTTEILYYDEVLTMSTKMYVFTQQSYWQNRYDDYAEQLEIKLLEAEQFDDSLHSIFDDTQNLNARLVEIEKRTIQLVKRNQTAEAERLLLGQQYANYKKMYSYKIVQALKRINEVNQQIIDSHQYWSNKFFVALLVQALSFVFIWFYLLHFVQRSNSQMSKLALTDELTQLHNRRQFNEQLRRSMAKTVRDGEATMMLALIDIDHFKKYNDYYGHPQGDQVLAIIGGILKKKVESSRVHCFRLGGEEFAILAIGQDELSLQALLTPFFKTLDEKAIVHQENIPYKQLTVSAGIAFYHASEPKTDSRLYAEADQALYHAKATGRNRIELFTESLR